MKASIKQISDLTGFSPATVSNALNNKRGVNRETAGKILEVAREIGYLSEQGIRQIKVIVYTANGAVVNDSPFFATLFAGIDAECRNRGYNTVMYRLAKDAPDYDARMEELLNDGSSALLILGTELDETEAARFGKAVAPVVILDNWYEDLPFSAVLIDNTDAASRAVKYLIDMGHREIGYLHGNYEIKNFYYRRQGYMRTVLENGLEYDPAYTFLLPPNMEGACEEMTRLLQARPKLPTAFFADNDMLALGAMRALQECGYRVPEDVSIVGFDNLPFCAISNPPLTTIKVYNYEMGCAAVRRLAELAAYHDEYQTKTQITSSFVERSSVRRIPR